MTIDKKHLKAILQSVSTEPPSQAAEDATIRAGLAAFTAQQDEPQSGVSWFGRAAYALQDWVSEHRMVTAGAVAGSLAVCVGLAGLLKGADQDPLAELHEEIETALVAPPPAKVEVPAVKSRMQPGSARVTRSPVVVHRLRLVGIGPLRRVASDPVSAIPMDVGSASFVQLSHWLNADTSRAKRPIRIDELVNAMPYLYRETDGESGRISATSAVYPAPWKGNSKLLHMGIRVPAGVSASAVEASVRFNPSVVSAYRLLGREPEGARPAVSETSDLHRLVRKSVQKQEVGKGKPGLSLQNTRTVTAIYELIPVRKPSIGSHRADFARLSIRYMPAAGKPFETFSAAITQADAHATTDTLSDDMRFGAAVVAFGQKFQGDPRLKGVTYDRIRALAESARGHDPSGRRGQFIDLIGRAETSFALGLGAADIKTKTSR